MSLRKYRLHWSIHPTKDQKWYDDECQRMNEDEIARELEINYSLSVSGKVFAPFKQERHVSESALAYDKKLPIYRIWDFGKTNAILYAQIDRYGRKRLLHERVLGSKGILNQHKEDRIDSNIQEQVRVMQNDCRVLFEEASEFIDICDPAGSYTDERQATPEVQYLEAAPFNLQMNFDRIIALPTRDRKVRGRSMITKDLQETPGGKEAFQLYCPGTNDEGCPTLKQAFLGGYCYKKDANGNILDRIKEPNHPYEDVIDCLIYLYLETDGFTGEEANQINWQPRLNTGYVDPYTGF